MGWVDKPEEPTVTERECSRTHNGLRWLLSVVGVLLVGAGAQLWYHETRISTMETGVKNACECAAGAAVKADIAAAKVEILSFKADQAVEGAKLAVKVSQDNQKDFRERIDKFEIKLDKLLSRQETFKP
jgi:hypothetical protein